jgi:uncharacterized membrane protein YhaH (DUF805 family)
MGKNTLLSNHEKRAKYDALINQHINSQIIQENITDNQNKIYDNEYNENTDVLKNMCSFKNSIILFFTRYFDFKGRSSRAEFCWWQLFSYFILPIILWLVIPFIIGLTVGGSMMESSSQAQDRVLDTLLDVYIGFVYIFLAIPNVSLQVRRLHDTGRSGWWLLLYFTIIGSIWIIVWNFFTSSEENANKYGKIPMFNK